MPPGLHQLVIYCPVTKRAFCKDVIVDLTTLDPYPEFPTKIKPPIKKFKTTRANVWRKWREDTTDDINNAFANDVSEESYDPSLFIKDQKDAEYCQEILFENFNILKVVFIEGLADSDKYPEISIVAFVKLIHNKFINEEDKKKLPKSNMELCFIRATRNDAEFGTAGTLCRSEMFDVILRVSQQMNNKKPASENLEEFLKCFIYPMYQNSTILKERKLMRGSKRLNQLLYDNANGLF